MFWQKSGGLFEEVEGFGAELGVGGEKAAVVYGGGECVLLFYAAHFHTEVLGVAHDDDAGGVESLLNVAADFGGEAFLHLEFVGADVDDAG